MLRPGGRLVLTVPFAARWHFVPHHLAHSASAFHASPFARASSGGKCPAFT